MGKTTQRDRVLQYMKRFGSITRKDAAYHIGCFELAARINKLEKEGWAFNKKREYGKNMFGDPTHWTRYSIKEET